MARATASKSAKKSAQATERKRGTISGPHVKHRGRDADFTILGTAHVSAESVRDVEQAFAVVKPDAVCVELCRPRFEALRDPDRWRKLDLSRLIKDKKVGLLVSSLILSSFQKKIGAETGVPPGAEMLRAAELAEKKKVSLYLSDREVRVTLVRAWRRVGFFSRLWLASTLLASLLVRDEIAPEEIERLKQEDVLADLFANLPPRYASIKHVIIDERDRYLAEKILRAGEEERARLRGKKRPRVLAVVGAGHLQGVERALTSGERADLEELHAIPKARRWRDILSWVTFSVAILGVSYYIGEKRPEDIWKLLLYWVVLRSGGAGLGALLTGAHPLATLVTVLLAPVSIFLLGTRLWMFPALTELWVRKPRVEDFENIARDTDTMGQLARSLYRNRVLNLFWIIMGVSMGLTVGNLIFFSQVFRNLIRAWGA